MGQHAEQLTIGMSEARSSAATSAGPGLLRGSKGSTYEGGVRVPGVVRWPGTMAAGRVSADMVSVMDWYPTFVALAGGTAG